LHKKCRPCPTAGNTKLANTTHKWRMFYVSGEDA
jgi:hypothetical protein